MKLFVRLYESLAADKKPVGIPDAWPASAEEVDDTAPDPRDGRLVMAPDEYKTYLAANKATYDAWYVDNIGLASVKDAKFREIDRRTRELIEAGFDFGGKMFSLSLEAQSTATGLFTIRDDPALTYPVIINTIDDTDFIEVKNASDVRDFYLGAVATYRSCIDSGTLLKAQVRAAATLAEVEAIKDPR